MPKEEDGAPVKQLVLVALVMLCNALPITILFPYLYFLVRDFHIADRESDIGYFAGFIGSSFMIGRFFTGVLWGLAADKYGGRLVMFCGILSVLVFNTMFGFCTNLWVAIVTRFCLGSMNGMFGTLQTYATEICNKKYRSLGLAVVSTAWGFGLIIGPAIGGFLAQPALKYPNTFGGTLFERFPYLLPPLCVTGFALLVLVACYYLPETLHNHGAEANDVHAKLENGEGPKLVEPEKRSSFQNTPLIVSIILFAFAALHDITYLEIFSLWAVSPKETGGLSFNSSDVGRVLTVAGFGMLVCQLGFFPLLARRLGATRITRAAAVSLALESSVLKRTSKLRTKWDHIGVDSTIVIHISVHVKTGRGLALGGDTACINFKEHLHGGYINWLSDPSQQFRGRINPSFNVCVHRDKKNVERPMVFHSTSCPFSKPLGKYHDCDTASRFCLLGVILRGDAFFFVASFAWSQKRFLNFDTQATSLSSSSLEFGYSSSTLGRFNDRSKHLVDPRLCNK